MKIILAAVAAIGIPVGAYAAIAATRAIWIRGEPAPLQPGVQQQVDVLEERVRDLEADRARLAEVEERLDFTERLLARGEPGPVGRGPEGG